MVRQVQQAIRRLAQTGAPVTRASVIRLSGVSRTFTYENEQANALIQEAVARTRANAIHAAEKRAQGEANSWRERALNAEEQVRMLRTDIKQARAQIADLLGQLRDPDGTWLVEERDRLREENRDLRVQLEKTRAALRMAEQQRDSARTAVDRARKANVVSLYPDPDNPRQR
jgi:regulator of replication initiation timing